MRATMLVACHKAVPVPHDDFYLPVHVGHHVNPIDLGFQPDDEGENISAMNRRYCELTGLFWAWKNLDADAIGLSHYRRYFQGDQSGPSGARILSGAKALELLDNADLVIGKPRYYYVETIDSHYRHGHIGSDLDTLRAVVAEGPRDLLAAFDQVLSGRKLSLYNMFLMRAEEFDRYAAWLFPVLAETALRIGDESDRTGYQQRTMGFLGERLLNVWAQANSGRLRVKNLKVINTEGEPQVRKAVQFAQRKLGVGDPRARTV